MVVSEVESLYDHTLAEFSKVEHDSSQLYFLSVDVKTQIASLFLTSSVVVAAEDVWVT